MTVEEFVADVCDLSLCHAAIDELRAKRLIQ